MFEPTGTIALLMTAFSAVCWGSWANTAKLTKNFRFELMYWDYSAGILLMSLIWALTLGSMGGGPNSFWTNFTAASHSNIASAALGGFIFNIANLLLVAGIELAGLAVAFPLAIGIAMVEGVVASYILQPRGDVTLLAAGVFLAVIAIIMDGRAYANLTSATSGRAASGKSVIICVVSGLLMGSFAPLVTRAMTRGIPLTPYGAAVAFTAGALLSCIVANGYLMRHPIVGEPVAFSGYFQARGIDHFWGILGGLIWGTGGVFNFVAGGKLGVAIAYAIGQSAPMVAALWGVFVWKEFAGAGPKAKGFLAAMFVSYILALIVIAKAYA
jgi:glucose uptake protein